MKKLFIMVFLLIFLIYPFLIFANEESADTGEVIFIRNALLASEMHILYNGKIVGNLNDGEYISLNIPVGEQIFFAFQFNAPGKSNYQVDAILLNIENDNTYYVKLTQNYGYANLVLEDNESGKTLIESLSKNNS